MNNQITKVKTKGQGELRRTNSLQIDRPTSRRRKKRFMTKESMEYKGQQW